MVPCMLPWYIRFRKYALDTIIYLKYTVEFKNSASNFHVHIFKKRKHGKQTGDKLTSIIVTQITPTRRCHVEINLDPRWLLIEASFQSTKIKHKVFVYFHRSSEERYQTVFVIKNVYAYKKENNNAPVFTQVNKLCARANN